MKNSLSALTSIILAGLFAGHLYGQADFVMPRTEWGAADLSGVWNFSSIIPLERPAFFGRQENLVE